MWTRCGPVEINKENGRDAERARDRCAASVLLCSTLRPPEERTTPRPRAGRPIPGLVASPGFAIVFFCRIPPQILLKSSHAHARHHRVRRGHVLVVLVLVRVRGQPVGPRPAVEVRLPRQRILQVEHYPPPARHPRSAPLLVQPERQHKLPQRVHLRRLREDHLDVRYLRRGLIRRDRLDRDGRAVRPGFKPGGVHRRRAEPAAEPAAAAAVRRRGHRRHRELLPSSLLRLLVVPAAVCIAVHLFPVPLPAEVVRAVRPETNLHPRQRQRKRLRRVPLQLPLRQRLRARPRRELSLDLLVQRPRLVLQLDRERLRVHLAPSPLQLLLLSSQLQLHDGVRALHVPSNLPQLLVRRRVVLPASTRLRPVRLLALTEHVERVRVVRRRRRLQPSQARLPRRLLGSFHTKRRRGGVERRQM
eukprot:1502-Pelagococcus_subviridis.AAC.2